MGVREFVNTSHVVTSRHSWSIAAVLAIIFIVALSGFCLVTSAPKPLSSPTRFHFLYRQDTNSQDAKGTTYASFAVYHDDQTGEEVVCTLVSEVVTSCYTTGRKW